MTLRRPLLVPAVLAAVLIPGLLAGCSSSGGNAAMATLTGVSTARVGHLEKTAVTVYAAPSTDSTGLYVAQYMGYFKAQGLTVNIQPAASAESAINLMAAGKVDMVGASYVSLVEAQENWVDEAQAHPGYISPSYQRMAANIDVFAEGSELTQDFQGLFVPSGSSIKSISQLKGQTIAIDATGGVGYVTIASALLAAGIQPTSVKWAVMPFSKMTNALLSGEITAAYLPEPYNSFDEERYAFTALSDLDVGLTADFPMEGYAVTKSWAQQNPNTLTAFFRALEQGQEIADTNRQVAEQATEEFIPGITPSIAAILTMETYPVGPVDASRIQRVADDIQLVRLSATSGIYNIQQILGDNG